MVIHRYLVPAVLGVFCAVSLAVGVAETVAPGAFFDAVGPFGTRNDHYIRDGATFEIANAVLLGVALIRRSWRVPALAFTAVRYGLHALNHVADIDEASPAWVGPADAIALGVGFAWLVAALVLASRESARAEPVHVEGRDDRRVV